MKTISYLRYLLNDEKALRQYFQQQKPVSLDELKRFILLKVRAKQYSVPDHYYRLGREFSFQDIIHLSDIFTVGLPKLADQYLEIRDSRVYVMGREFNEWQLLLPDIPPLLLIISKIWKEFGPNKEPMIDFAHEYILPSAQFTALPSPYIPAMMAMGEKINGFSDLHIHLNGAIETDLAWADFLRYPDKVYDEIKEAYKNPKVKEQIEQMTDISHPIEFMQLFEVAGRLRQWLYVKVMQNKNLWNTATFEDLLEFLINSEELYKEHPFILTFGKEASPLILEGMLYVKILDYLASNRLDFVTAGIFHYYLLILGLVNRLLVQQTDAFGFEQFQKYTTNNLREVSEKTYGQRFLQLAGNDLTGFRHTEGRFSPKDSLDKNLDLTDKIISGFHKLEGEQTARRLPNSTLSLVAHFIKKDDGWKEDVRFRVLREELKTKTDALIALKKCGSTESDFLVGVDAAASEFDTPPEVFAPSYNRLRDAGFSNFTFHAGEDFYHVLTGLRAIYEVLMYFNLRAGDRIGHAVASGVDIALWRFNIGEQMWMRKEDYLDDLVFSYYLIASQNEKGLEHLLPIIALRCEELASEIYERSYGIHDLIRGWKYRANDPLDLDFSAKGETDTIDHKVEEMFRYRHSVKGRKKGEEIIMIDTYDILKEKDLIKLQLLLLKVLHDKQIIIETLPTSNIIIGQHHDFRTYHLYNWYKWGKEGNPIPAIVVGTDDAGIFATNIYNEYCHIYCLLVFEKGLPPMEAMNFIQYLTKNADIYQFR